MLTLNRLLPLRSATAEAASQYRFVLGLLSEGRERWKDVAEEDKGSTFRFTFERKVKMYLIGTLQRSPARGALG